MAESMDDVISRIVGERGRTRELLDKLYASVAKDYDTQRANGATSDEAYMLVTGRIEDMHEAGKVGSGIVACLDDYLLDYSGLASVDEE